MIKKHYKVIGMDCDSCAKMIELDLEDAGIACKCDFAEKLLVVEFDKENTNDKNIKEILGRSGYQLEDQK